jgi:hypothetical protein
MIELPEPDEDELAMGEEPRATLSPREAEACHYDLV